MRHQVLQELVTENIPENAYAEQWNIESLKTKIKEIYDLDLPVEKWAAEEGIADQEIRERLTKEVDAKADAIAETLGREVLSGYENAKSLTGFVDGQPELKALMEQPPTQQSVEAVGHAILASGRSEIRINGAAAEDMASQADRIGFAFQRQYMDARGLMADVESASSRNPVEIGKARIRDIEKMVLLQTLDHLWREHLVTLEHLRQVIGFRSYGQRDPLNEYKSEGFLLFEAMLARLREAVTGQLMHIQFSATEPPEMEPQELPPMQAHHINPLTGEDEFEMADAVLAAGRGGGMPVREPRAEPLRVRKAAAVDPNDPSTWGKVARNDKCPCGSGKKFKHCHGRH
jgi:preprotein translocase subunit SecA